MRKLLLLPFLLTACTGHVAEQTSGPEVISLLGVDYFAPTDTNPTLDSNLSVARKNFESNPSEENYIWLGRRTAYLTRYNEAIRIYTEGIEKFPTSYKLYRHRGHRYISQRKFDEAIADLNTAVKLMKDAPLEMEPDGLPNKINQPLSNTQFNVWYHLGLAYYLTGDFANAERAYLECMTVSNNDDLIAATTDWLYMAYRRQGKTEEAKTLLQKITPNMTIVENDSYFKRLQMYQGLLPADSVLNVSAGHEDADLALATQGHGVGNWYLYCGDSAQAKQIFEKVVKGKHFSAFGFIAAEADLARVLTK